MSNGKTVFIALAAAILCAAPTGAHGALRVVTSTADFAAIAREVGGGLGLIELEREKVIGKVAETHYSFSYVNDIVTLLTESVPQLLQELKAAAVDILILVPV